MARLAAMAQLLAEGRFFQSAHQAIPATTATNMEKTGARNKPRSGTNAKCRGDRMPLTETSACSMQVPPKIQHMTLLRLMSIITRHPQPGTDVHVLRRASYGRTRYWRRLGVIFRRVTAFIGIVVGRRHCTIVECVFQCLLQECDSRRNCHSGSKSQYGA